MKWISLLLIILTLLPTTQAAHDAKIYEVRVLSGECESAAVMVEFGYFADTEDYRQSDIVTLRIEDKDSKLIFEHVFSTHTAPSFLPHSYRSFSFIIPLDICDGVTFSLIDNDVVVDSVWLGNEEMTRTTKPIAVQNNDDARRRAIAQCFYFGVCDD